MIYFGLTEEYLAGFNARVNNIPFDQAKSDDWKMGWINAEQALSR